MAKKRKKPNEPGGAPKESAPESQAGGEAKRKTRTITAKDAGWISPTAFVAPITLVPIDPPRPLNRRRPEVE